MSYIQLIEKVELPTSLWLTFWDLDGQHQVSLEIATAPEAYVLGAIYSLDRDADFEHLALEPVNDPSILDTLDALIPLPTSPASSGHSRTATKASTLETATGSTRPHNSLVSLLH